MVSGFSFEDAQQPVAAPHGFSFEDALPSKEANPGFHYDAAAGKMVPGEGPTPQAEPNDLGWVDTTKAAAAHALSGIAQTYQTATGEVPKPETTNVAAAQPLTWNDLKNPSLLGKKILYGVVSSSPTMAGGFLGGLAASPVAAASGPVAPLVEAGGVWAGSAVANALQEMGPTFAEEMQASPKDPDGAFHRAWVKTGIGSAFTGASFAAFGIAPFEGALKNLLFQGAGVQPAMTVAQTMAENVTEGKPLTENATAGIPGAIVNTIIPGAITHAAGALLHGRTPTTPEVTPPETPPGTPLTPEAAALAEEEPQGPQTPPPPTLPGRPLTPEAPPNAGGPMPVTPGGASAPVEEPVVPAPPSAPRTSEPALEPMPPAEQAGISELQNIGQGKPPETPEQPVAPEPAQPPPTPEPSVAPTETAPVGGLPLFTPYSEPRTPPHVPVHEAPDGSGAMTDLSDEDYAALMNRSAPEPPVKIEGEHPEVSVKTGPGEVAPEEAPAATRSAPGTTPFVPVPKEPKRLIPFLQQGVKINEGTPSERTAQFGLKDQSISHKGGDLLAIMGSHQARPGFINNTSGEHLDDAAGRAYQAGYFDHRPDINELLDAIRRDHEADSLGGEGIGNRHYAAQDYDAAHAHHAAIAYNEAIGALAREHGLPLNGITHDEFMAEALKREMAKSPVVQSEAALPPMSQEEIDYWNNLPEGQFQAGQKLPLYSPVERAVDALPQARGTGHQMFAQIAKTPGVKPEEMQWLGLEDWMKGQGHVTKQQIADYVRANALDVQEVVKGGEPEPAQAPGVPQGWGHVGGGDRTRYGQYKLPGGENYREMLIAMPPKSTHGWEVFDPTDGRPVAAFGTEAEAREDADMRGDNFDYGPANAPDNPTIYRSPHWEEPNVLAHVRFDERTAPDGARVLMVHEVQSDYGQAMRKTKQVIDASVDNDFHGIVERMKDAGAVKVGCD